jgi:glutamine synthetase
MGDTVMSVRHVVKELARQADVTASFMPKPLANVQGSGMHTHLSLWRDDQNAFIGEGPTVSVRSRPSSSPDSFVTRRRSPR